MPKELITRVVFDQSLLVKRAIGLPLTSLMIPVFLGSMRATTAVFVSISLSALAAYIALALDGSSISAMVLEAWRWLSPA